MDVSSKGGSGNGAKERRKGCSDDGMRKKEGNEEIKGLTEK